MDLNIIHDEKFRSLKCVREQLRRMDCYSVSQTDKNIFYFDDIVTNWLNKMQSNVIFLLPDNQDYWIK